MTVITQGAILHRATRAELARLADDPYGYCIAHFSMRSVDRELRTVTFKFEDGSELTFNIRYEVAE